MNLRFVDRSWVVERFRFMVVDRFRFMVVDRCGCWDVVVDRGWGGSIGRCVVGRLVATVLC